MKRSIFAAAMAALSLFAVNALAQTSGSQALPTGQSLTPLAAPGARFEPMRVGVGPVPDFVADGAAALAVSPNGREMLALTSGFNLYNGPDGAPVPAQSTQHVLVYRLDAQGATWVQTLPVPNSFSGIAWRLDGRGFYVAGGVDDVVHVFSKPFWSTRYAERGKPIALGHAAGLGDGVKPQAAGIASSPDGRRLLVANYYNDSVTLIDLKQRKVLSELDLRPGRTDPTKSGVAGGAYPFAIVWRDNAHAFVSAARDREILALDISGRQMRVSKRLHTLGEPTAMAIEPSRKRLFAVEDNADRLAIIDPASDTLLSEPRMTFPDAVTSNSIGKGFNPNAIAFASDKTLIVTLGGINAAAFVQSEGADAKVVGLAPTGWYPSAVAVAPKDGRIFVANRKSPPGPNSLGCGPRMAQDRAQVRACSGANQYVFQLEKAGLLQFPAPDAASLTRLTLQVAENVGLARVQDRAKAEAVMQALHQRIAHVVFIIKENRTYDQVLGDLEIGDGDPALAILGRTLTPNHHDLARSFVTLDNFYDSGEQSSTGWTWSTAGRTTDLLEKTAPVGYAGRGLAYEAEGTSRGVNTAMDMKERRRLHPDLADDPDLLPGPASITSPDAEDDAREGQGFLWNAAVRAGLSVRNYGFANDEIYGDGPGAVPLEREPHKTGLKVYESTDRDLAARSDPYFRGYDQKFPDYWRVQEWMREFAEQDKTNTVPNLTLLRISHDHFGDFDKAIDGVNTVETEMADNDYATGLIVERIARSNVKDSTLVFVIEDDAQNGADHVDARRSIALIAGPYVRQKALVSTRYTTVSLVRTIGAVLGLAPLGMNDALATPMADVFDLSLKDWTYKARPSEVLRKTALPIVWPVQTAQAEPPRCPLRSSDYWAQAMAGQDFSLEDRLDTEAFNAALWRGLAQGAAPSLRHARDLRQSRPEALARATGPDCPRTE